MSAKGRVYGLIKGALRDAYPCNPLDYGFPPYSGHLEIIRLGWERTARILAERLSADDPKFKADEFMQKIHVIKQEDL